MSKVSTKEKVRVFTCPGCGASQEFNPKDGGLTCPYCGHKEAIASGPGEIKENSYLQYLKPASNALERIASDARDITCAACGAVISFTGTELADTCPFCGTNIATPPKPSDPTVAPEGVVPFVVTRDQATQYIGGWLRSRWFAPQALKKFAGEETIGGVYLPYWTYDSNTKSFYTGERGEHYWETESYSETDSNGNTVTKTRQVMKTRWYGASGDVSRWFDDLLVPATTSVNPKHLHKLGPWDLTALKPYDPAYLAGFQAQRYQVDMADGFEAAKEYMAGVIRSDVREDIGGDEQRISSVQTQYSAITFKYILLPVYIGSYRLGDKAYQILVNALTGHVDGDRPYSVWKIALLILVILLIVAGFVLWVQLNGR